MDLFKVPAKDALAYGRNLLDILFSKSEQKSGILFASNRSTKPALDLERATLLIGKSVKLLGFIFDTHFVYRSRQTKIWPREFQLLFFNPNTQPKVQGCESLKHMLN